MAAGGLFVLDGMSSRNQAQARPLEGLGARNALFRLN